MDHQQYTIDLIEGRVSPDDYACQLDANASLLDWLQSCIPAGEMMNQAVSSTFAELTAAELPADLHRRISDAIDTLRLEPAESSLAALLPLLNEAGRLIPLRTTIVFHLADTYAAILDGTLPCSDAQRRALPGMLLEAIDQPFDRAVMIPYSIRTVWEGLKKDSRPGTLGFRLNLHGWITDLLQRHRPELDLSPDTSLEELHDLLLTACPDCVDGPEIWACGILEHLVAELPEGLKRSQRTKLLKERIAETFHLGAKTKRPRWLQSPDWPVHEGRPMRFLRTEKRCGGEMLLHHFVDDETGTERIVEDFA